MFGIYFEFVSTQIKAFCKKYANASSFMYTIGPNYNKPKSTLDDRQLTVAIPCFAPCSSRGNIFQRQSAA